ncbi:glucose-methanol-choline oxidoreductase [Mycena floridula]|nr:glucose-methanol-choline oxidoreductase [Mycena floridula]
MSLSSIEKVSLKKSTTMSSSVSVLLVERGPLVEGWTSRVPVISCDIIDQKAPVYRRQSAPLTQAVDGKTITMLGGKALGGNSKVNAMLYTRSVPGEFNAWEAAGRKDWGWKDVEPFFTKSETSLSNPNAEYRGKSGPWQTQNVEKIHFFESMSRSVQAASSLGIPVIHGANNPTSSLASCTFLDATIDSNGMRNATSDAFLPKKLVQSRKNLDIVAETLVSGLEIREKKVVDVYLEADQSTLGQRSRVAVDREIIMCAGAIVTPQILLLRIGPAEHLKQHDISVVKDLPGVGSHLQDHISVPIIYKIPLKDSLAVLMGKPLTAL